VVSHYYFDPGTGVADPIINLVVNILSFAAFIAFIVGVALVFEKANSQWWKALIPFYQEWTVKKIAKAPSSWYWTWLGTFVSSYILWAVFLVIMMVESVLFWRTPSNAAIITWVLIVLLAAGLLIASYIFHYLILHKFSKGFGRGGWFALGLLFLRPIFWLILALDKSVYRPDLIPNPAGTAVPVPGVGVQNAENNAALPGQNPFAYPNAGQPVYANAPGMPPAPVQYDHFGQPIQPPGQTTYPAQYTQQGYVQQGAQMAQPVQPQQFNAFGQPISTPTHPGYAAVSPATEPKRLSRLAIVGIILLILVPILACCVIMMFFSETAMLAPSYFESNLF